MLHLFFKGLKVLKHFLCFKDVSRNHRCVLGLPVPSTLTEGLETRQKNLELMKDTDFLRHDPVSRINIIDKMLFLAGAICIGIPSPALLQTAATGEVSAA